MEKKEMSLRELYNQIPDEIFEIVSEVMLFLKEAEDSEEFEISELDKL